jgi:hypothetical protein
MTRDKPIAAAKMTIRRLDGLRRINSAKRMTSL